MKVNDEAISPRPYLILIGVIILIMLSLSVSAQNKTEVYNYVMNSKLTNKEVVTKQIWLETGHLKCTDCSLRYNNLFGLRLAKNATEDNPKGYLKFDTWQDSVHYVERWQTRHKLLPNESYEDFLVRIHWASDVKYIEILNTIKVI